VLTAQGTKPAPAGGKDDVLSFFVVVMVVMGLLGTLAGFRLWLPLRLGVGGTAALWAGVQLLAWTPLALLALRHKLPSHRGLDLLAETGWLVVGWLSVALFAVLARDLLLGGARALAWASSSPVWEATRGGLGGRTATLWLCGAVTLYVAAGFWNAGRMTRTVEVEVPVAGLHPDLEGLRIVQLSDLHIGPGIRGEHIRQVVDAANSLEPDLVAFTGDLADALPRNLAAEAAPFLQLRAPLGRFFITGNHEYYSDVDGWLDVARNLGFRTLVNEHAVLERGAARLLVAGVPDLQGGRFRRDHVPHPDLALAGAPEAQFRLLLCHQPALAPAARAVGYDLMLSGHTHGGQYHPYTWMAGKANLYLKGLNRHEESLWVYVSQGTGTWGPRIRVGTAPEITLLVLRGV